MNKDVSPTLTSLAGTLVDQNAPAYPCGLAAKYIFTDSFSLYTTSLTNIPIKDTDISLPFDKSRYKNIASEKQWLNIENEHAMVWF